MMEVLMIQPMDPNLAKYLNARIEEHIHLLPSHMREGIRMYIFDRIEPGGFMTAVLANDLKGAVSRADSINKQALVEIVQFVIWALPSNCHGSYEKVQAWLRSDDLNDFDETENEQII